ncbi:hypothetical protein K0U07_00395 [bacterium]|nr:hypothetical protein [bacterium]
MTNFLQLHKARSYPVTTPLAIAFGCMMVWEGQKEVRKIARFIQKSNGDQLLEKTWQVMKKILFVTAAFLAITYTVKFCNPTILKDPSVQTVIYHTVLATAIPYWAIGVR